VATRRRIAPVVFGLALAIGVSGGTLGASGNYGWHYAQASCYTTTAGPQIYVPAPQIFASAPRTQSGTFTVGSQHNQWVAYKVNIFFSSDGVNWKWDTSSAWRAAVVGDGVSNPISPSDWWDFNRVAWVNDTLSWTLNTRGYYRAAIEFYWFADQVSSEGYDYVWADHFDYASTNAGALLYCTA
jgi:hypothetical protein